MSVCTYMDAYMGAYGFSLSLSFTPLMNIENTMN